MPAQRSASIIERKRLSTFARGRGAHCIAEGGESRLQLTLRGNTSDHVPKDGEQGRIPADVRAWRSAREVHGTREARGASVGRTQVHSVRLPSFTVSTEAVFAAHGERLAIRHDAGESAAPYIAGTLIAIRAVPSRVGLMRGLDQRLN